MSPRTSPWWCPQWGWVFSWPRRLWGSAPQTDFPPQGGKVVSAGLWGMLTYRLASCSALGDGCSLTSPTSKPAKVKRKLSNTTPLLTSELLWCCHSADGSCTQKIIPTTIFFPTVLACPQPREAALPTSSDSLPFVCTTNKCCAPPTAMPSILWM